MANYKPKIKAVIDRSAVVRSKTKYRLSVIIISFMYALMLLCLYFMISFFNDTAAYIVAGIGAGAIILFAAYKLGILTAKPSSLGKAVYYFETDTVSSTDLSKEIRMEYVVRRRGGRFREVTYYKYTVYFGDRVFELEYNDLAMPERDKYSKLKNSNSIPSHMTTLEQLSKGDKCYLLMKDEDDKIIDVFAEKYYTLSQNDFREENGKYYLTIQNDQ